MKHKKEAIQVRCCGARPLAFRRLAQRPKAYVIERILRVWVVQTAWWAVEIHHTYYEVVAGGGVYLLCRQSRAEDQWSLLGVHD